MSFNKIIQLTIIACFVVLGYTQVDDADDFTLDQYLGTWYDVGSIRHGAVSPSIISCEWRDVTTGDGGSVEETFAFVFRGKLSKSVGTVTLANSVMSIRYADGEGGTNSYQVWSYNNGNDLILNDLGGTEYSVLISRNTVASAEAREDFEKLAADIDGYAQYITEQNCF